MVNMENSQQKFLSQEEYMAIVNEDMIIKGENK